MYIYIDIHIHIYVYMFLYVLIYVLICVLMFVDKCLYHICNPYHVSWRFCLGKNTTMDNGLSWIIMDYHVVFPVYVALYCSIYVGLYRRHMQS